MGELENVIIDIRKQISNKPMFKIKKEKLLKHYNNYAEKKMYDYFNNKYSYENEIDYNSSYRTIIKLIYAYAKEDKKYCYLTSEYIDFELEILDEEVDKYYDPIRNLFDQHETYKNVLSYDERSKTITKIKKDSQKEMFARVQDKVGSQNGNAINLFEHIDYFFNNKIYEDNNILRYIKAHYNSDKSKNFFNELFEDNLNESELKVNVKFKDFEYFDLIKFAAALDYIALHKYSINFNDAIKKVVTNDKYVLIRKKDLIDSIFYLTNVNKKIIGKLINLFIYNYEYQKNHHTLIQMLYEVNNHIIFSPTMVLLALLPIKLLKLIKDFDYAENEKNFSYIAKIKENEMINQIGSSLNKDRFEMIPNYILKDKDNGNKKAEYDILMLDKRDFSVWIIECKWFMIGDDEKDHHKLNDKISKAINDRKTKNKYLLKDRARLTSIFNINREINKCYELLISQNYIGVDEDPDIPSLDYSIFKQIFKSTYNSSQEIWDEIINQRYIPNDLFYPLKKSFDYYGYHFDIDLIGVGSEKYNEAWNKNLNN